MAAIASRVKAERMEISTFQRGVSERSKRPRRLLFFRMRTKGSSPLPGLIVRRTPFLDSMAGHLDMGADVQLHLSMVSLFA